MLDIVMFLTTYYLGSRYHVKIDEHRQAALSCALRHAMPGSCYAKYRPKYGSKSKLKASRSQAIRKVLALLKNNAVLPISVKPA